MKSLKIVPSVLIHTLLIIGCLLTLLPLFWMVTSSFKTYAEIVKIPMVVIPHQFYIKNYIEVFQQAPFGIYYMNSILVTVVSTVATIITSTSAGYSLAKFNYKGKNLIFLMFIASMMVPFQIRMIPLYSLILNVHLVDKLTGVIALSLIDCFGIFLMRQFLMDIPDSYAESARMEGASELRILWSIMSPMCKPALSALTIILFMWNWEWYLWPVIVLTSPEKYTLPIGLANFSSRYLTQYGLQMAATTLVTIPVVVLFLIFQRRFVEGVVFSGLKG